MNLVLRVRIFFKSHYLINILTFSSPYGKLIIMLRLSLLNPLCAASNFV
jgi:hypothetical protein